MANANNYFRLAGSSMGVGAKDLLTAFGPEPQFGTRASGQASFDPSKMGELAQMFYVANLGKQSQAEQARDLMPIINALDDARATRANELAKQKFGQEIAYAALGALGRGIQTGMAGGDKEMVAYIAQGPVRAAEAYQRGLTTIPRQDVPVFSPQPYPNRQYFS
jgi:hypothetical protein